MRLDTALNFVVLDVGRTAAQYVDPVAVILGRWSTRVLVAAREQLLADVDDEHLAWNNEVLGVLNAVIEAGRGRVDPSPELDEEELSRFVTSLGYRPEALQ